MLWFIGWVFGIVFLHIYICMFRGVRHFHPQHQVSHFHPAWHYAKSTAAYFSNFLCDVVLGSSSSWDLNAFVWGWLFFKHWKSSSENTNLGDGSRFTFRSSFLDEQEGDRVSWGPQQLTHLAVAEVQLLQMLSVALHLEQTLESGGFFHLFAMWVFIAWQRQQYLISLKRSFSNRWSGMWRWRKLSPNFLDSFSSYQCCWKLSLEKGGFGTC